MTLAFESRQKRLQLTWLSAFCASVLCAGPALAEDAETRTAARDLATQGARAFEASDYAQASDFFRRAHELVPAPSIALLEARSLAKLGQLLEASDIYEQTARFKLPDDAPLAYREAVVTARTEMEDVRRRLPRLKVVLLGVTSNESVRVTMDNKPTPAALLGVERPIDPGHHRLEARVDGQLRATRELSIAEGQIYQIDLEVGAPAPSFEPVAMSARAAGQDGHSWRKTGGYIGLGLGALGIGIGTYTGIVALNRKSELDAVCHPSCPPSSADAIDSFRSNRTVSYVSFGIGVAAAATGAVLLVLGTPSAEHVALRAQPGGLTIGGRL